MTSFYLFAPAKTAIENNSLNISTGNYYAVLVQTLPDVNTTTVGGLNFCSGAGYTAVPLSGLVYIPNSKWTFDDFRFSKAQFSTPVLGVVICKRLGALPAITDIPIVFSSLINSFNYPHILKPGNFAVDIDIPTSGLIQFETFTGYSSGTWNNALPYSGDIFSLIGTNNNTVPYSNPCTLVAANNKVRTTVLNASGTLVNTENGTDRNSATNLGIPTNKLVIIDFWGMGGVARKLIKPGKFYFQDSASGIPLFDWKLYGSNDPNLYNDLSNPTYYTELANIYNSNYNNLANGGYFFNVTNPNYWRFLIFQTKDFYAPINEIALYESTVISNTINFA
jgi:hypothetical protein